ncbi:MAG: prepilin-type N-terminal cleavage/methylation domain-containing protein [Candidatus Scalindua sp.]|nr:prepilin-type N-terminal cleavage/methylation domain-containing protein [Candidatus Scalindua sp.]
MWKFYFKGINRGFTLIELLITIGIVSVLIGIGTIAIVKIRGSTKQVTCMSNLKNISNALQLYYNDYKVFPDDGYPDDASDLYPLYVDLEAYISNEKAFVCPEDNDPVSSTNFESYDPFYVARTSSTQTESIEQLAIGCPRHRKNDSSTSLFSTGSTEITKVGTVLANGLEIPPDGDSSQRKISTLGEVMEFKDSSTVTIDISVANYEVFLVQSVRLSDGTLYSIIRVQGDGTISTTVTTGSKFEILTPSAIVGVRGTVFTVTTSNNGSSTDTTITQGEVVVIDRASGESTTLTPGPADNKKVAKAEHIHAHWHADGTYHNHSHPKKKQAHHGKRKGKRKDRNTNDDLLLNQLADTSVTSSALKTSLIVASPLSKSVLRSAINRAPAMTSSHLKDILVNESPLKSKVLRSITKRKSSMSSSDNMEVFINNSPLKKRILIKIKEGKPPMNSGDLQAVIDAQ